MQAVGQIVYVTTKPIMNFSMHCKYIKDNADLTKGPPPNNRQKLKIINAYPVPFKSHKFCLFSL